MRMRNRRRWRGGANCCRRESAKGGAEIALAGNPNVGKSTLMNHLTGVGAVVSNYPGTTVEVTEGNTTFEEKTLGVADLPGIYSLKCSSEDERVALKYVREPSTKVAVNVVDATKLERNLFLTLQLLSMNIPLVVALNFYEEAEDEGILIDAHKLSSLLGVPVVPIDALRGAGIEELMEEAVKMFAEGSRKERSAHCIPKEEEEEVYKRASKIAGAVIARGNMRGGRKREMGEILDRVTTEPLSGTIIMLVVLAALFASLFVFGSRLSELIGFLFEGYAAPLLDSAIALVPNSLAQAMLHAALVDGINAGLQIAVPYVFVFYFIMAVLEDSGYLPRMAFLLDKVMHRMGLHGKAVIPMMLGFGCSVPAILSTRVLPSRRERLLTAILITLIPCSARTAVILGAVGAFLGWEYALSIYGVILALILLTGFVLGKMIPGERLGLIMELPPYRVPALKNVFAKTWMRTADFVFAAFPLVIAGSAILGGLAALGVLPVLVAPLAPVFEVWLMLPPSAAITLIFGILRKELALEMLVVLGGSTNL
ncbi:MAG: ferrous iron transporter B, partial [Candidatus Micrarchaeota archaeon]